MLGEYGLAFDKKYKSPTPRNIKVVVILIMSIPIHSWSISRRPPVFGYYICARIETGKWFICDKAFIIGIRNEMLYGCYVV